MNGLFAAPLAAVSATAAYASLIEPYSYELTRRDVPVRDLPPSFDGFQVAQISDLHHSALVSIEEVRRVVELANSARPDLIALTGDYVTSRRRYIEPCAEALAALRAPEGVWAVLGNHDHYVDAELLTRAFERRGIRVLSNANTELRRGGESLQLAGVDDWGWGRADWARALHGIDRARPTLLLSHEPAVFDMPETEGLTLILSGHTHGGQIRLPFIGSPATHFVEAFKYGSGLYERRGKQLYVSRGTGTVGVRMRLGARPEIPLLHLRRRT